jgi:hypothetical protein
MHLWAAYEHGTSKGTRKGAGFGVRCDLQLVGARSLREASRV